MRPYQAVHDKRDGPDSRKHEAAILYGGLRSSPSQCLPESVELADLSMS